MPRGIASRRGWRGPSNGTWPISPKHSRRRSPMLPEVLERDLAGEIADQKPALATVAVVGLGYVGLPVAVEFGKQRRCIGYDLSKKRIDHLRNRVDANGEVSTA